MTNNRFYICHSGQHIEHYKGNFGNVALGVIGCVYAWKGVYIRSPEQCANNDKDVILKLHSLADGSICNGSLDSFAALENCEALYLLLESFDIEPEIDVLHERLIVLDESLRQKKLDLVPHFSTLNRIKTYSQLLALDVSILKALVEHEDLRIEKIELENNAIDFQSSGHHRDKLDIYRCALAGELFPKGIYISINDDGKFHFNPADALNDYESN